MHVKYGGRQCMKLIRSEGEEEDVTTAGAGNHRFSSLARGFKSGALIPINVFIMLLGSFRVVWAKKKIPIFSNIWGYPTCKLM